MSNYTNYNKITFDAFQLHTKKSEIIDRKKDIMGKILDFHNLNPQSYLFVGFNPLIFSLSKKTDIFVTEIDDQIYNDISKQVNLKKFDRAKDINKTFDCVIANDEYLTFANDDTDQINKISNLCSLANDLLITTVKDYKNQEFKEREYSQPVLIRNNNELISFMEIHNWDLQEKNSWITSVYELSSAAECKGLFNRKCLYFKQLAKFCKDYGATDFLVHKNLMYKSLIKKNYEHIISVRFDK